MRTYLIDLAERTIGTYLAAFLGLLFADGVNLTALADIGAWQAAAIAAIPAGITVIKGALATFVGDGNTAALLPRKH